MAWQPGPTFELDQCTPASLLSDNLKASGPACGFAAGREAIIVDLRTGRKTVINPSALVKVLTVALETIDHELTAVVLSEHAAEFHCLGDTPSRPRLTSIQTVESALGPSSGEPDDCPYFRACAALGPGSAEVCVGCSTGEVLVLDLRLSGSSSASKVTRRLGGAGGAGGHGAPIACLATSAGSGSEALRLLASADDDGEVRVWDPTRDFALRCVFEPPAPAAPSSGDELTPDPPPGHPCTSLALRGDVLVAAFAHGVFRCVGLVVGGAVCHATRCITRVFLTALVRRACECFASVCSVTTRSCCLLAFLHMWLGGVGCTTRRKA